MLRKNVMVRRALAFATAKHLHQKRKYTGESYIVHLIAVANKVVAHGGTEEMVAAALLHDVLEDTDTMVGELRLEFGQHVTDLVVELTDVSVLKDGNRAARKALDREHLANASAEAQTIKLADLIDNASDIMRHDQNFAAVYLHEKEMLLKVLTKGNPDLMAEAQAIVKEWRERGTMMKERMTFDGIMLMMCEASNVLSYEDARRIAQIILGKKVKFHERQRSYEVLDEAVTTEE